MRVNEIDKWIKLMKESKLELWNVTDIAYTITNRRYDCDLLLIPSYGEKYISMPKGMDPLSVTLEDAIALIEAKRQAEAKRVIRTFAEDPDMQVLNGRYGPYISYKEKNYRIPAEITPEDLNLEGCFMLIKLQEEKASMPRKRGRRAAKKE